MDGGSGAAERRDGKVLDKEGPRVAAFIVNERDQIVEFSKALPGLIDQPADTLRLREIHTLFEGRDRAHFVAAWTAASDGLAQIKRPFTFGFTREQADAACNLKIELTAVELGGQRHKLVVVTDVGAHLNPSRRERDKSYGAGRSDVAMAALHHLNNAMTSLSVSASMARERVAEIDVHRFARAAGWLAQPAASAGDSSSERPVAAATQRAHASPGAARGAANGAGPTTEATQQLFRERLGALDAEVTGRVARCLEEIEHVQEGLKRLDMLSAYLREELDVTVDLEMTDAASIVHDTVNPFRPVARSRGVQLVAATCPNVGLVTDRHRVVQILRQLVVNALDSCAARSGERKEPPRIELSWSSNEADGSVSFRVRDTGEGFEPSRAARLWEPGYSTRDRAGHGLHDAANLVQWLGGRMTAHSEGEHRGATFALELPLISA